MSYKVTFTITTEQSYTTKVETVTRRFPQYLCGIQMTNMMFIELMLAEYPMSSVGIENVERVAVYS